MAHVGTLVIPIRVVVTGPLGDLLETVAGHLEYIGRQGFDGAETAAALADELREWLAKDTA